MKSRDVVVHSQAGTGAPMQAKLLLCAECDSDRFSIFVLQPAQHQHLQCEECGTSYCDGACGAPGQTLVLAR